MDTEMQKRLQELNGELNGNSEHDRAILMKWAERLEGKTENAALLREIGRLLFRIDGAEAEQLTQQFIDQKLRAQDDALAEARRRMRLGKTEEALQLLQPLVREIGDAPLPDDCLWMDFHSYLDGLLFQDYFADEIEKRELRRHPLRPGKLLYTYACLLIERGLPDEALETLQKLIGLDPVCPEYLFELGEAYKRVGAFEEAYQTALWALECASTDAQAARCCRDLGYCLAETGAFEDASAIYQLSIRFQPSAQAEAELRWIGEQNGAPPVRYGDTELLQRCGRLGVPTGLSETVKRNLALLDSLFGQKEDR